MCSGRNLQFTIGLHSMTSESINQISSNTEVDRGLAAAGWRSAEPHYEPIRPRPVQTIRCAVIAA